MEIYEDIKNNKDSYIIDVNLFECPICKSVKNSKGFLQHVKRHFYKKDFTKFIESSKKRNQLIHQECVNNYNNNPNICLYCYCKIIAKEDDNIQLIKKKKFCSKSCSASYNNSHRKHSVETRKKISNKLKKIDTEKYENKCANCNCKIDKKKKFCSKKCFLEYNNISILTKQQLQENLIKFIELNQYVPNSKFNRSWSYYARKYFGTWNNMIIQLGYKPNNQKFGKKILKCKDGHIADSISEKIVDDWLFENNIRHERKKKYPNSNKDCDFYLIDKDIWLEYFGLAGELDEYDQSIKEKKEICFKNNLKLVEIYPKDLYPKNKLSLIL